MALKPLGGKWSIGERSPLAVRELAALRTFQVASDKLESLPTGDEKARLYRQALCEFYGEDFRKKIEQHGFQQ